MNAERLKEATEGKEITMEELAALVNQADSDVVISIDLATGGGGTVAREYGTGYREKV